MLKYLFFLRWRDVMSRGSVMRVEKIVAIFFIKIRIKTQLTLYKKLMSEYASSVRFWDSSPEHFT